MNQPYRGTGIEVPQPDPRWVAETARIAAQAAYYNALVPVLQEINRGIRIANELMRQDCEGSESYKRRIDALNSFFDTVHRNARGHGT